MPPDIACTTLPDIIPIAKFAPPCVICIYDDAMSTKEETASLPFSEKEANICSISEDMDGNIVINSFARDMLSESALLVLSPDISPARIWSASSWVILPCAAS